MSQYLSFRKGLISDGMLKYSRNPNYLGEIMVYSSFVLLVNDTLSYICVIQVWFVLFTLRIWMKERSYRRKEGWPEYKARSWILLPKVNGRTLDSLIFYGTSAALAFFIYANGGLAASIKLVGDKWFH